MGYALACKEDSKLILKALFVDPRYHGRGVGADLLKASLSFGEKSMQIELILVRDSAVAKAIYEKFNFRVIGPAKRKFFWCRTGRHATEITLLT